MTTQPQPTEVNTKGATPAAPDTKVVAALAALPDAELLAVIGAAIVAHRPDAPGSDDAADDDAYPSGWIS